MGAFERMMVLRTARWLTPAPSRRRDARSSGALGWSWAQARSNSGRTRRYPVPWRHARGECRKPARRLAVDALTTAAWVDGRVYATKEGSMRVHASRRRSL
jgi:hypothetical protein